MSERIKEGCFLMFFGPKLKKRDKNGLCEVGNILKTLII